MLFDFGDFTQISAGLGTLLSATAVAASTTYLVRSKRTSDEIKSGTANELRKEAEQVEAEAKAAAHPEPQDEGDTEEGGPKAERDPVAARGRVIDLTDVQNVAEDGLLSELLRRNGLARAREARLSSQISASRDAKLYVKYAEEAIKRSQRSFYTAVVLGAVGFVAVILTVVFAVAGGVSEAVASGFATMITGSASGLLYRASDSADKRSTHWFGQAATNLDKADSLGRALDVLASVDGRAARDRLRSIASMKQLFPEEGIETIARALEGNTSTGAADAVS
ncbi:hypothetical protein [Amycolatopsis sp. DSM 110486]|uniref:TRADD-N-associated membrane domain-containing protein n=1 Tax=Amycolatopsis sp. DSM 110486 TaxID=2865832 RepID=UPI001C698BED|nr:hypothetical protein [Amycolatopsis sp. DSM 110486]QYN17575.1 hypothetical protein K1T34_32845 [Amycolatopsis sp. DSM 110486]